LHPQTPVGFGRLRALRADPSVVTPTCCNNLFRFQELIRLIVEKEQKYKQQQMLLRRFYAYFIYLFIFSSTLRFLW